VKPDVSTDVLHRTSVSTARPLDQVRRVNSFVTLLWLTVMGDGVVNSQKAPARSAKAGDVSTAGASDEKRSESQPSNASGLSDS